MYYNNLNVYYSYTVIPPLKGQCMMYLDIGAIHSRYDMLMAP